MQRFVIPALALCAASPAFAGNIVETASGAENLSTLVKAVQAAELVDTLSGEGPFTVFAPVNEAFDALEDGKLEELLKPEMKDTLTSVLTYHVVAGKVMAADVKPGEVETVQGDTLEITVEGDAVMVDGAKVVKTDIKADNGVVHLIDAVIMPAPKKEAAPPPPPNHIVTVASGDERFSTLVELVKAAGLVDALSADGALTVFAPTNEAFAALGEDTLAELQKPESKDKLANILKYHVLPAKVMAADVEKGKVDTLAGEQLKVKVKKGEVTLDKTATVIATDIEAINGVVHVIDAVLMP